MEDLVRERRPLRQLISRLEVDLIELLSAENPEVDSILAKFGVATDTFEKLQEVDQKFLEYLRQNPVDHEAEDEEFQGQAEFKMKLELLRIKVEKMKSAAPSNVTTASVGDNGSGLGEGRLRNFKLPTVQIPRFTGELKDWLGYWAQFEKIDQDVLMSGSDKFVYLLQSLDRRSDAYKIVSRFPQSNENYSVAVEALKKKYADPDLLLEVYMRELLGLIISNFTNGSKKSVKDLYLELDSHIRSLRTLKVEEADPSIWLLPLVEASLPQDILRQWKRSNTGAEAGRQNRLDNLLKFMEMEVDISDRVEMTRSFSEMSSSSRSTPVKRKIPSGHSGGTTPTLAAFQNADTQVQRCFFCNGKNHEPQNCYKGKGMTLAHKRDILRKKSRCFYCFGFHHSRTCNNKKVRYQICDGRHFSIMCEEKVEQTGPSQKRQRTDAYTATTTQTNSNQICDSRVALQTLKVCVIEGMRSKTIRVFLDPGSQRTYILTPTAAELNLESRSVERVVHSLFDGMVSTPTAHQIYSVTLASLDGMYKTEVQVRSQNNLCSRIPNAMEKFPELRDELLRCGVQLSDDSNEDVPVEMVIGNDRYGRLLTGQVIQLQCGLTAIETHFGWTLSGELETVSTSSMYMSMAVSDATIAQLWKLDAIGIEDPEESKSAKEKGELVKQKFVSGTTRNADGRFRVRLPWKDGHPILPSNREVAFRRLENTVRKLKCNGLLDEYDKIFLDWEKEGFLERVTDNRTSGHYIPHRPVIKRESSTTPVRPVFDGSCKTSKQVSFNDCQENGPNLIQLIPDVLLRFRLKKVAFVADIRKAFQMVEVAPQDRDLMRFLWCENGNLEDLVEFRHSRVMFGATSSPFILGAVLESYLKNLPEEHKAVGTELWQSFYVDNCVASVDCQADYIDFRENAVKLLQEIKMELRLWYSSVDPDKSSMPTIPVLGLLWHRETDTLTLKMEKFEVPKILSKRTVLSSLAKIYDPIGFCAPALLQIKLLLQQSWIQKLKWDDKLPEAEEKIFLKWIEEVTNLKNIHIPRWVTAGEREVSNWSLHVFNDASSFACASAVFLRVEKEGESNVQLLSAKSRVAPLKKLTIPRLELLSCLLGARLASAVKRAMKIEKIATTFWNDSTTAVAWIKRTEPWGSWVGNRVAEIRKLTCVDDWRHVAGDRNPADLPSRGCSPKPLLESGWWNGPDWLKRRESEWPSCNIEVDEELVFQERKRKPPNDDIVLLSSLNFVEVLRHQYRFKFHIRIFAWVKRFLFNAKSKKIERRRGGLSEKEIRDAEIVVWRKVQEDYFHSEEKKKLGFEVITDQDGLLRVKTRLTMRNDPHDFKFPILIPGKSPLVEQLISDAHFNSCHAGVGILLSKLRERYWIFHGRKTIRNVISKCHRCKRYSAKALSTPTAPLPLDRIKDCEVFQTIGVDLAGPLIVRNGKKCWILIFSCAVYRAVYFTTVGSCSATAFIVALKRFIQRYRRPDTIYCDNGTNFRGASTIFKKFDWRKFENDEQIKPIVFKHSPPLAAWYGGWWERLIGSAKAALKRTVGNGRLNRAELEIQLEEISRIMNQRPLTYVSEDPSDLEPLTPSHFLNPLGKIAFPEGDATEAESLRVRVNYMRILKTELQSRFRKEFLAMLVSRNAKEDGRDLKVGDLVLVGSDSKKRLQWPMGRIMELFAGKDNVCRVARIKTADGELTRAVQRLFPLEMDLQESESREVLEKIYRTRSGRIVKKPARLGVSE